MVQHIVLIANKCAPLAVMLSPAHAMSVYVASLATMVFSSAILFWITVGSAHTAAASVRNPVTKAQVAILASLLRVVVVVGFVERRILDLYWLTSFFGIIMRRVFVL